MTRTQLQLIQLLGIILLAVAVVLIVISPPAITLYQNNGFFWWGCVPGAILGLGLCAIILLIGFK